MNGFVDIYTLIFLVLAVVIFFKLRGVLGQRTGNERPPFDPFARRKASEPEAAAGDKVVALPRRPSANDDAAVAAQPVTTSEDQRIAAVAQPGTPLASALAAIIAADRNFDPQQFIDGARTAYEMIVTAFAQGDRKALKPLLGREVYDGFAGAIGEREARGETVEFNFVGFEKVEMVDGALKNGTAQVSVKFVSKLISATRDKAGEIVDGDAVHIADVTDIWTFARDVSSRDPNWLLVATETVE
ncbi:calcium-binding protein [Kaistia sp. 32K]|uniref:Tim44/TimA family putative adaptor protein n=1 Tax=Kaistia sp. 32K TaxID=2795690 RepID=UPI0019163938|nr:Tim44/TimA family putative adaptor protein [Kaistia sp. 32K]BCP55799.1 calcium-binding protein [Kaistia sp. 32K]